MLYPTENDLRIRQTILDCAGNASKAAEVLGISLSQIYSNLKTQRQIKWWLTTKAEKHKLIKKARHRRDYLNRLAKARESERFRLD